MIEDELLKWKFKCGSRDALCRIYEKYVDFLLTLAIALSNDVNMAEDAVHDVFVSFAASAQNFRVRGSLKNYLATCVINRLRDQFRADQRQPAALSKDDLISSDSDSPEQLVITSEESLRLNNAVNQIQYQQRETVILHIKGGLKFRQIARLQGVSVNTVQGRYRYALKKLRLILNGEVQK